MSSRKGAKNTQTFAAAYGVLEDVAQKMRSARTPMVDELLPLVESAVAAKKVCDARIAAVRKMLLEQTGDES